MLALATGAQTLCPPALPFSFLDKHASILAHKMLPAKVLELDCVNDLASRTQSRQSVRARACACVRARERVRMAERATGLQLNGVQRDFAMLHYQTSSKPPCDKRI